MIHGVIMTVETVIIMFICGASCGIWHSLTQPQGSITPPQRQKAPVVVAEDTRASETLYAIEDLDAWIR